MINKKKELEHNILICEQKLDRVEKLIGGLGGEKDRWTEAARVLGDKYDRITGDVLLSSGVVAYLGPFTVGFRNVSLDQIFDLTLETNGTDYTRKQTTYRSINQLYSERVTHDGIN